MGKGAAAVLAGGVLVAVGALWAGTSLSSGAERSALDNARIVVLPFRVSNADSSLAYLREGIVDILGTKLTGEGGPVAVDPRTTISAWRRAEKTDGGEIDARAARRIASDLGAGRVLLGEIVRTGTAAIVINGTVLSVPSGEVVARSNVNGASDSLLVLVNRFVAELLALHAGEVEQRLSVLTETPLPALRAFLEGRKADRRGNYESAVGHYTRAIEFDSTFALAGLELAASAGLSFRLRPIEQATADQGWYAEFDTTWRRGVGVATRQQGRLGSRDRIYLIALRGSRYPASTPSREQLGNWQRAVDAAPDRAEGWYRLGHTLLYQGPAMGLPDPRARAGGAFRRALELDSSFMAPVAGLIEIAAFARDTAEVRRLSALYFSRDSIGETADYLRWRAAPFDANAAAALRAVRARFTAFGTQTLSRIQWTSQVGAIEVDDGVRAISELERRAADPLERTRAWLQMSQMRVNRGRPDEARQQDHPEPAFRVNPHQRLRFGVTYALFWDYGRSMGEESAVRLATFERALLARPEGAPIETLAPLMIGTLWRLSLGDTAGAARTISLLRRAGAAAPAQSREAPRRWGDILEPLLAAEQHRADAGVLLDRLDSLTQLGCCAVPHWAPFVVAKLRERAGEPKAALAAIRRARWYFPPEYLSGALREEGRLAALTGDVPGAISAYRDYLALRAEPEPAWRADAERVRVTLRELERSRSRK